MGRTAAVHQFLAGATPGDAIFDQAVMLRGWLRGWGHSSQIYAHTIHHSLVGRIPHFSSYRPGRQADDLLVFHYSIGSDLSEYIRRVKNRVLMIFHNVTPPEYLAGSDPDMEALVRQGKEELGAFRNNVLLALGDSEFNRLELAAAGYARTGVLPITLDEERYAGPSDPSLAAELAASGPNVLFVGRIAPNKRQDDVIKAFYYYRLIEPGAQLYLVGMIWRPAERYYHWLRALAAHLGLADCVHITDHVSFEQLLSYYQGADLFLCLSEHEGFGKPLIESMLFDVPVLAYSATAVPYTLGDAGVQIHRKVHPVIAELMHLLTSDQQLRQQVLEGQRRRYEDFRPERAKSQLRSLLDQLLAEPLRS